MKKENAEELVRIAPNLYSKSKTDKLPSPYSVYGFQVRDGWFEIIKEASLKLEAKILELPENERENVRCSQVKEKFGSLRINIDGHLPGKTEIVMEAEEKANKTCEICGDVGSKTKNGWNQVICGKCKDVIIVMED